MDWQNEEYVKINTRDTISWLRLRWQGQVLFMALIRKVDKNGEIPSVYDLIDDLSFLTGIPGDFVSVGVKHLLDNGFVKFDNDIVTVINFKESQRRPQSPAQRQRKFRAKHGAYADRNPEKNEAHKVLHAAVRKGDLKKMPCEECGSKEKVQAHHEDYNLPLEVVWLCPLHHRRLHTEKVDSGL